MFHVLYLNISDFQIRKAITKIRCSDHVLEIEKGRHRKIPRADRICKFCDKNSIETELQGTNITLLNLFYKNNLEKLGKFIIYALEKRTIGD